MTVPTGSSAAPKDLATACFLALALEFFDSELRPVAFSLRDKLNTQDDPFDEYVKDTLNRRLPTEISVIGSGKPLVSPDLVVARPEETRMLLAGGDALDERRIISIEVKKLDSDGSGRVGRATGLDYNSTPPSRVVKIEAKNGDTLRVPAFYLFVLLASIKGERSVQSLALIHGSALNNDIVLYERATGIRQKSIGLGSYGDGIDRQRPMFVFANPLGWSWLRAEPTLVHHRLDLEAEQDVFLVRHIERTNVTEGSDRFGCFRIRPHSLEPDAIDPFPTPANRRTATTQRGRFVIDF